MFKQYFRRNVDGCSTLNLSKSASFYLLSLLASKSKFVLDSRFNSKSGALALSLLAAKSILLLSE